ncbi:MAG: endolytic transglycosylase MltG [Anaerolineaceae bacterium]|nr:endolytic transglycosylase MltG [Anaerolineaceae bacterium]
MKTLIQIILIMILVMICLALAGGALLSERLPRLAAEKFGPPDTSLTLPQRVMYSYRLLANEKNLGSAVDPQGKESSFAIGMGESVNSIASRLEEEGFISNADTFRTYLIYAGLDMRVQAGEYLLSPAMTPVEISVQLMDAVPEDVEFNILSCWRVEEIAAALPTSGIQVTETEFLDLVQNPPADILPAGFPQDSPAEGFLMPGSYQVKRDTTPKGLLALFLNRFNETVTQELRDAYTAQDLDLFQAVTLASIVQREAVIVDEQPVIASVFFNRMASGMKLESDPTVQYALGYQLLKKTWWKNPLSSADLQFNSSYNTYVYPGLPPGPISNPSFDALRSVAFPAQTGYYYFRAQCDGSGRHSFSVTYAEHLQNGCP